MTKDKTKDTDRRLETLRRQLQGERAKREAYEQLHALNMALIAAIVGRLGEVRVGQAALRAAVDGQTLCRVRSDPETEEYILWVTPEGKEGHPSRTQR